MIHKLTSLIEVQTLWFELFLFLNYSKETYPDQNRLEFQIQLVTMTETQKQSKLSKSMTTNFVCYTKFIKNISGL